MARRFSIKAFNIANYHVKLKFESEQLHEDGTVLADNIVEEVTKTLTASLDKNKDALPETITESVYNDVGHMLADDPTNVYANMLGDEYPRTRLVSVELTDTAGNSTVYED